MAQLIDGKKIAAELKESLVPRVAAVQRALHRPPGLGVILVGEDPASQVYVRNKEKAAAKIGLHSSVQRLPANVAKEDVLAAIRDMNLDSNIDAYLVQLPLPEGLEESEISSAVDPQKDADGLHGANLGKLMTGVPAPRPCTPSGVMEMLRSSGCELEGAHAVVVGRSTIVGKPQALLLLAENATVTVCHSRTKNLAAEVGRGDIVIAAVGRPELIRGEWIKEGATVIDVGINRVDGKLVGDVEFSVAQQRARAISPVPGGVGPMTIGMLLQNAVQAAEQLCDK